MTNTQMIEQAIETMRNATQDLNKAVNTTAYQAVAEAKALEVGLRDLLAELVAANEDCSHHFVRFQEERGKEWDKQSTECRSDWSRAHDRRLKAENAILKYAQAVLKVEANAA